MIIEYKEQKEFLREDLEALFLSVGWESGEYSNRLVKAMKNSSVVISAWSKSKLIGLARSIDDGATVAFIHYVLVNPAYQKYHIGSELMKRILDKYKDILYVKVMPSSPNTIDFYSKLGFKQYDNYSAMVINNMSKLDDFKN